MLSLFARRAAVRALPRSAQALSSTPESDMAAKLRSQLDATANTTVEDVRRGVEVESPRFEGLGMVKQHKLVQECLKEEIAAMHGFTLKTAKPPAS